MEIFFLLLIIPFISAIFCRWKFKKSYTMREFWTQVGVQTAICAILAFATYGITRSSALDTEILNGVITGKHSQRTSCSHSYPCRCRTKTTGSGSSKTTTTVCDTCYMHPYDVDWVVNSSVGSFHINRVNAQGTIEPPRFSSVKVGEPASREHTYENFVKAVPDSIFNQSDFDHFDHISTPNYPKVYDYYRVHHVINHNSAMPQEIASGIDSVFDNALISVGRKKEVNIITVFTSSENPEFSEALRYAWLNGKKNDVVIVIGTKDYPEVSWVKSFGWSKNNMVYVSLEDSLSNMTIDATTFPNKIVDIIEEEYERRPFDEFKYLLDELSPPIWLLIVVFFADILITVIIAKRFLKNDEKYR